VDELSLYKYNYVDVQRLTDGALFISANRAPVAEFNLNRLREVSSSNNPVAVIRPVTSKGLSKGINSHFDEQTPGTALLCVGALVSLVGYNIFPKWGLHNGALGYVVSIVFEPGKTPNNGDHPVYVVVDFPSYNGPAWRSEFPKVRKVVTSFINTDVDTNIQFHIFYTIVHSTYPYLVLR
jgi:hypothetical protein